MSTRRVFVLASLAAFAVLAAALEAPQASSAAIGVRLMRTRRRQLPHFVMHPLVGPPQPDHPAVRQAVDKLLGLTEHRAERLDPLVERYPDCISVFEWRGLMHFHVQARPKPEASLQSARKDFDRAIQLAPDRAGNYYNRAVASFELGDWAAAEADCSRALEIGFEMFDSPGGLFYEADWVLKSRAALRAQTGNWQGAVEDYSRLLNIQTASGQEGPSTQHIWSLHWSRALCFLELRELESTIADYDVAVRVAQADNLLHWSPSWVSTYAELFLDRAYAQAEAGQIQVARAGFQKVVEIITQPCEEWNDLFPKDITAQGMASTAGMAQMSLGYAHAAIGETKAARLNFERAAEFFATHKAEALQTQARLCIEEIREWS